MWLTGRLLVSAARGWAASAHNNEHRRALLEMAKAWSLAALQAEQGAGRATVRTLKRAAGQQKNGPL
jgi:hypothetical protein